MPIEEGSEKSQKSSQEGCLRQQSRQHIETWAAYFESFLKNPANDTSAINPRVSDVLAKVDHSAPGSVEATFALNAQKKQSSCPRAF